MEHMSDKKLTTTGETRREYLARKQRERRARLKAEGLPRPTSGPSGKSGGSATVKERVRRYREKKKAEQNL